MKLPCCRHLMCTTPVAGIESLSSKLKNKKACCCETSPRGNACETAGTLTLGSTKHMKPMPTNIATRPQLFSYILDTWKPLSKSLATYWLHLVAIVGVVAKQLAKHTVPGLFPSVRRISKPSLLLWVPAQASHNNAPFELKSRPYLVNRN